MACSVKMYAHLRRLREERKARALIKNGGLSKKLLYKDWSLKCRYDLSLEAFNLLRCLQRFACAICKRKESELKRSLDVDHNHKTGVVRSLLCSNCNVGIGHLRENLEEARQYLAQ